MHEFNAAQDIADAVLREIKRHPDSKVLVVRVVMGRLRGLVPENLDKLYKEIVANSPAGQSRIEISYAPLSGTCESCKWQGQRDASSFLCPKCGSTRGILDGGRELFIEEIETESGE